MGISDELETRIKEWCTGPSNNDLSTLADKFRSYYDLDACDPAALSRDLYDPDADDLAGGDGSAHGRLLQAVALVDEVRTIAFVHDWCVNFGEHAGAQATRCRELSAAAMAYELAVDTIKASLNYAIDWAVADLLYGGSDAPRAVYDWLTNTLDEKVSELDESLSRGLRSDPTGPFTRVDTNRELMVVTSMIKLYDAGGRTFPRAAKLYEAARDVVSRQKISGLERYFPRSVATYNELVDDLLTSLKNTDDEINRCGTALVAAGRTPRVSLRRTRRPAS